MPVDVYLFPAVIGGGLGDIDEVLAAGRYLARAGFPIYLLRLSGRPLPSSVEGPWDWPPLVRTDRVCGRGRAAVTVTPCWGVSAAPRRPGPLGRAGPWADEAVRVESHYGADRTVHVSLEEFARSLPSAAETRERLREGGLPSRALGREVKKARIRGEESAFRTAFERFRAFDRPNVLHLYAGFAPSPGFRREFPNAVASGPLWSGRYDRTGRRRSARREWVWYASPASAERIAPIVRAALTEAAPGTRLFVRSPRPWSSVPPGANLHVEAVPLPEAAWRRRFARADVRIVTGSRSLLEAIELGGPFLYFNGVLGAGTRTRRHRPEKILALLAFAERAGVPTDVRRDLADFSRARRIGPVVRRVVRREGGWRRFAIPRGASGFSPPYDAAGALVVEVGRALAAPGADAGSVVRRIRRAGTI